MSNNNSNSIKKQPFWVNQTAGKTYFMNPRDIPTHSLCEKEYTRSPENVSKIAKSYQQDGYDLSKPWGLFRCPNEHGEIIFGIWDAYTRRDAIFEAEIKYNVIIDKIPYVIQDFDSLDHVINTIRSRQGSSRQKNNWNHLRDCIFHHKHTSQSSTVQMCKDMEFSNATIVTIKKVLKAFENADNISEIDSCDTVTDMEFFQLVFEKHYRVIKGWHDLTRHKQESKITWNSCLKVIPYAHLDDKQYDELVKKQAILNAQSSEQKSKTLSGDKLIISNLEKENKELLTENKQLKKQLKAFEKNMEQQIQKRLFDHLRLNGNMLPKDVNEITDFVFMSNSFGISEEMTVSKEKMLNLMIAKGLTHEEAKKQILQRYEGELIAS